MHKLLLFFFALMLTGCQTIPPGWVQTGQSNPGQTPPWIMAANPGSIKVNGQTATMISVMSFNTPQATNRYKNGYSAVLITNEYKCGEYQRRILKQDLYENKETIVGTINTPTEFKPITPSSAGEKEYNLACSGVKSAPTRAPIQQQKPEPAPVQNAPKQNSAPQPSPARSAPMTMSDIICQTHEMVMLNQILPFRQQGIMGVGEAQQQFNSEDDAGTRVFLKQYVRQLYADPAWGEKTLRSGQFLKACAKVHRGY
jgi:hypothetical protein